MLLEGASTDYIAEVVLNEHLLFEGFWGDTLDKIKGAISSKLKDNPISSTVEAAKAFGDGISGVSTALTGIVRDGGNVIDTVVSGAQNLMSKGLSAIQKNTNDLVKRIDELSKKISNNNVKSFVGKVMSKAKGLVDFIVQKVKEATSAGGWKGLLATLGAYLAVKAVRPKTGGLISKILQVLSGKPKEMLKGAQAIYEEFAGDDDEEEGEEAPPEGESDEDITARAISKVVGAVKAFVWGIVKKVLTEAGTAAVAQMAGPAGWIKQLADIFQKVAGGVAWVCEGIMEAISRAKFKPITGGSSAAS